MSMGYDIDEERLERTRGYLAAGVWHAKDGWVAPRKVVPTGFTWRER